MKSAFDERVGGLVGRWVVFVQRHARFTASVSLLLTLGLGAHAFLRLGINSDNASLIARSVPARAYYEELIEVFPNLEDVLLVVVEGETPEIARAAAKRLESRLREDRALYREVYTPGLEPFFERNGLLYLDVEDLYDLADQIARVQPLIFSIEREPTLANFSALLREGLETVRERPDLSSEWASLLARFAEATLRIDDENPRAVSWEDLFLRGTSREPVSRWVVVVDPVLDYGSVFAAREPIEAIRRAAAELEIDAAHGARVRVTGNPALNLEEMTGILRDVGIGGVFCFFVVVLVLFRALRSLPLVLAAVVTLLSGLIWTTSFAAAAVGALSLLSVSFAILFIGLGVDFAIHLGMAYADRLGEGASREGAMTEAVRDVGSSLVLCSVTTAIGFYVFIPTDNLGVAELGLIAGTGMLINLALNLTLLPALLAAWLPVGEGSDGRPGVRFDRRWWRGLERHPRAVLGVALLLGLLGAALAPRARFDANVVHMRDPETESVQAFEDLMEDPGQRSPWPVEAVARDLEQAKQWARQVSALDTVSGTVTLADYIPARQAEKLEILADIGFLLDRPAGQGVPDLSVAQQVSALRALREVLGEPWVDRNQGSLGRSMRRMRLALDHLLERIDAESDPGPLLSRLEAVLISGLEDQIRRLRDATEVSAIARADLPEDLVRRMLANDGRARLQVFPKQVLSDEASFDEFAQSVLAVLPMGTGIAVNMVAFAEATRKSFFEALGYAVVLIGLLLLGLWRRLVPPLLVMAPLALSSLLTVAAMAVLDIRFNFANVVVIPLLVGIGVDSSIHLVHRAESPIHPREELLATPTARAVFYSALTTIVSFGSLAFASHRGVASLGGVLTIGMLLTLFSNLVVLPALLTLRASGRSGPSATHGAP